jgi:hypothetical protein
VTEGLTPGVGPRDHCGCAQAVAKGWGTPRTTPRVDQDGDPGLAAEDLAAGSWG